MIAIFIAIIIFISTMAISCFWCKTNAFKTAVVALTASVIVFLVTEMCIITAASFTTKEDKTECIASQEIIALQDASSVSGSFFLGSGTVGNTEYYAYYFETEHGYQKGKINAESSLTPVYIKYVTGDDKPHIDQYAIVTYETLTKKPSIWLSIFAYFQYKDCEVGTILASKRQTPALLGSIDNPTEYRNSFRIEIHVPPGSIKENYEIDLR